jgi:predicted RecA/RadA family phage recombinase
MKNFVQMGDTVTFTAPAGGAASGIPLVVGSLVVVPVLSAAEGYECEGVTTGVFEFDKLSTDTPAQFDKAYWDAINGRVTTTATGNTLIGVFMHALATGTDKAEVRLNGVAV